MATRSSVRSLLLWLGLGVVLVRMLYVVQPLRSDEGGYLLIARQWHSGAEFLYGDYYVDRPPLLMAIFRAAAASDWDPAIRVLTIPFALVFVLAAAWAGSFVGGTTGARWSAVVAAAVMCSPALAADQADGELFASVFVMVAVALALCAWHAKDEAHRLWPAVGAGVFAGAAPLVKQNFLEGVLFVAVLVIADVVRRRRVSSRAMTMTVAGTLGAALPHAAVWLWAVAVGVEPASVWLDLVAFRGQAFEVIWSGSTDAPLRRAAILLALGLVSGVLLVVAAWFFRVRRTARAWLPEEWAISLGFGFGLVALVGGGSYWPHYLLQLAPLGALAVGAVAPLTTRAGRLMRGSSRVVVGAALLGSTLMAVVYATIPWVSYQQRMGEWLADSGRPGDTAVVLYGQAAILEAADMSSPYPHLWSLPMRTLDPQLTRLRATLESAQAPAWVVEVAPLNSWQIDDDGRLQDVLDDGYRVVAEVCGHPVWLRTDLARSLAPDPRC